MKISVAQAIVKYLELNGIDHAFGIVGSHYLSFFHALKDSKIKFISVKHEGAASLMALNYAKISQKPALVMGTAGPGAMNLLAGIAEMFKANIPCFVLTPIVPTYLFGKNSFQEDTGLGNTYSISNIFSNITKRSIMSESPDHIPQYVSDLFRCATSGRRGPVHLLVPTDHFEIKIDLSIPASSEGINDPQDKILDSRTLRIADELVKSKKPVLLIGHRSWVPNLSKYIAQLSNDYGIPLVATASAKGLVDEYSPYFGGILDLYGHRSAEVLIKESDLVLSIGEDFGEFATLKYDPDLFKENKLVQIDVDECDIGRNYPVLFSTHGDIDYILKDLVSVLKTKEVQKYYSVDIAKRIQGENKAIFEEMADLTLPLKPQIVFNEISEILPPDAFVFGDIGANGYFALRYLKVHSNSFSITMCNYTMGQGVAGCIGGKVAAPERIVISINGDGAFLMHGMEIATAKQYNIPIIWVIFVEGKYNVVEWAQKLIYGNLGYCTSIFMPDLKKLADSFSIDFYNVTDIPTLKLSFAAAFESYKGGNMSSIIQINYDKDEPLPLKPRTVKFIQDIVNIEDFKSTPTMMRAIKKVLKEKV